MKMSKEQNHINEARSTGTSPPKRAGHNFIEWTHITGIHPAEMRSA